MCESDKFTSRTLLSIVASMLLRTATSTRLEIVKLPPDLFIDWGHYDVVVANHRLQAFLELDQASQQLLVVAGDDLLDVLGTANMDRFYMLRVQGN